MSSLGITKEDMPLGIGGIDLSQLPPPKMIEELSYEAIKEAMIGHFHSVMRGVDPNYVLSPSDPAAKVIEVAAFRETKLRARINDAAKECLLAFAQGPNLEHLAALFNVERETLPEIDPDTRAPKLESDRSLRSRTLLSLERFSTAGAYGGYIFQAKKVGTPLGLHDVNAYSPSPGDVHVVLLFADQSKEKEEANRQAKEEIERHLNSKDVKPLTDRLTVSIAKVFPITISAELSIPIGVDENIVLDRALASLEDYAIDRYRVGADINVSGLHHALFVKNVNRVSLKDFTEDKLIDSETAAKIVIDRSKISILRIKT